MADSVQIESSTAAGGTSGKAYKPSAGDRPFLQWPGWAHLRYFLWLAPLVLASWVVIFGGADWLAAQHSFRVRIHFDAELELPFVPVFVLGYVSLNVLLVLAPFVLRSRQELQALAAALIGVTAIAGIGFVMIPAEAAYPAPTADVPGRLGWLLAVAKRAALRHNMVPSLHVALAGVCALTYATRAGRFGGLLLSSWLALIAVSTLLIHQHHVIDVATGLALAWAGKRFIFQRLVSRTPPFAYS